ncbi:fimbrial protein [Citrobacter sp. Marseille-Q6884]|uniref:fimbrial protein n=1 Tax=Citrobacter sp. Marseille-Q6884 TaxID=2956786 RepID=UPI0021B3845D|nr:fimbrial protein [Citrobacter sp. Marseille-Q6884]
MTRSALTIILLLFTLPTTAKDNISIDFTATIKESTCSMKITGGAGSDTHQTLTLGTGGKIGLDKIVNGDTEASANFRIVASNCTVGLSKISSKIAGKTPSTTTMLIEPTATGSGYTQNIGVGFFRKSATGSDMFEINQDGQIIWTADEIANGLDLTAALRESIPGQGKIGDFKATATFSFSYE